MTEVSNLVPDPLVVAEAHRMSAWNALDPVMRREFGQFFTPEPLATYIAGRLEFHDVSGVPLQILDAGAGLGSLGAALLKRLAAEAPGRALHLTAVELDSRLLPILEETRMASLAWARSMSLDLKFDVVHGDFVEWAVGNIAGLYQKTRLFDVVIMNPPYLKIPASNRQRLLTAGTACEVVNLYAAFVALGVESLLENGQLIAITPRSFTNGPYFRSFRQYLANNVIFRSVDLFESRSTLFADTDVLQENIIYSLVRTSKQEQEQREPVSVRFHGSRGAIEEVAMAYEDFMSSSDPHSFIHLRKSEEDYETARRITALPCSLDQLGISVSTGRVVDFRVKHSLRTWPEPGSVPLLYPQHLRNGKVKWPLHGKKPNALTLTSETLKLVVPRGNYVAIKRFSSKEERRRVSPTWLGAEHLEGEYIALENHLNFVHSHGAGLDRELAIGLTLYLGCTTLDRYFRQFSGHTQVNATDIRSLRFPDADTLRILGRMTSSPGSLSQDGVDALVESVLWGGH